MSKILCKFGYVFMKIRYVYIHVSRHEAIEYFVFRERKLLNFVRWHVPKIRQESLKHWTFHPQKVKRNQYYDLGGRKLSTQHGPTEWGKEADRQLHG